MKRINPLKALLPPYILISSLVTVVIGLTIPKGLFISGGVIILILFNRIYTRGEGKLMLSDALFLGSIISISGLALLLVYGTCYFVPRWISCAPSIFRATGFAIVYFPLIFGLILWVALRLSMIIKAWIKRERK